MNILLVNQYFPPDASATASVFKDYLEHFRDAGHYVRVVCGRPSYNVGRSGSWRPWRKELVDGIVVEQVGSSSFRRYRMLGRFINYLTFMCLAALRVRFGPRPDVVITGTDPPLAILPTLVGTRAAVPVLYSLQDLHPDASLSAGLVKNGGIVRAWERLHRRLMCKAHLVVVLSESMRTTVLAKGIEADRVTVIPNGSRSADGEPDPSIVQQIRGGHDFVALHAGNLGAAGEWLTLKESAALLPDDAAIVFVGAGASSDLGSSGEIRMLPFFPSHELASVMAAGDLQIVTVKAGMECFLFPSKLHSILMHGRPVLLVGSTKGELAQFVRKAGCGLVTDGSDPLDVAEKIRWAAANRDALQAMGVAARRAATPFDRSESARRWLSLVEEAASVAYGTGA